MACKKETESNTNTNETDMINNQDVPWHAKTNIYEVNVRAFSKMGNMREVTRQIPRLKMMNVDVIWLMPIQPIGEEKRKGRLGSPYSIKDYRDVSNKIGDKDDFRDLVNKAHEKGMKVILDWVANHTAWDHHWVSEHPEFYTQVNGNITEPLNDEGGSTGWTDVADLNYDNLELRKAMIADMKFWVDSFDIDGFRCDMAGMVPIEFWAEAIPELEKKKDLFMLAEWEDPAFHEYFDMTYAWEFHHLMNDIAKGSKTVLEIDSYIASNRAKFPDGSYRMNFITNHDENAWQGTTNERMGPNRFNFAVLSCLMDGVPLLYNGQEADMDIRLSFFDKSDVPWSGLVKYDFYKKLLYLKKIHPALWNGKYGAPMVKITDSEDGVYAFKREKDGQKVMVFLNFSDKQKPIRITEDLGPMFELFASNRIFKAANSALQLGPHSYRVYTTEPVKYGQ
jgi:glycosidase